MPRAAAIVSIVLGAIWGASGLVGHSCLFTGGCLWLGLIAFGWWLNDVARWV